MRVLVTGGTGFIGSNLVLRLLREGNEVVTTGTPSEQDLSNLPVRLLPEDLSAIPWASLGRFDVVFHQAAINDTTLLDRARMFRANVETPQLLFQQAVKHGCARIVYASSTAVYGDVPAPYQEEGPFHPLNPYAESKLAFDIFSQRFARLNPKIVVVGLRYCNVYGPRENHKGTRASMIYQLAQQMREGNPKLFAYGEQRRDYVYVDDAVEANLRAAQAPESCIVNCGSGTATSFNELVEILNEALGLKRVPTYIDNPHADRYQSFTQCDMTQAKARLGFVPAFDLRSGIRRYAESGFLIPV